MSVSVSPWFVIYCIFCYFLIGPYLTYHHFYADKDKSLLRKSFPIAPLAMMLFLLGDLIAFVIIVFRYYKNKFA